MTITREDVADLRAGDVVELQLATGSTIRGALTDDRFVGGLGIAGAGWLIRDSSGDPAYQLDEDATAIVVVSRAPRPLYVNHDRTEPVPGDVVREEGSPLAHTWHYLGGDDAPERWWRFDDTSIPFDKNASLILLVDGTTGRGVAS